MKKMHYVATDPRLFGRPLVPKRRAPVCAQCGRTLWESLPNFEVRAYKAPKHNKKGERLGTVPNYSHDEAGEIVCYMHALCRKRAAERQANEQG